MPLKNLGIGKMKFIRLSNSDVTIISPIENITIEIQRNIETLLNLNTSLKLLFAFLNPTNKTIPKEIMLVKIYKRPIKSEELDKFSNVWIFRQKSADIPSYVVRKFRENSA